MSEIRMKIKSERFEKDLRGLLSVIVRDCESGEAPLDDTWWMDDVAPAIHETVYERAKYLLEQMESPE